jgi:nicotinamide phosphoribosyltransferase
MLKMKIGDKAIVTQNNSLHGFEIGEEVQVISLFTKVANPYYTCMNNLGETWCLGDNELKPENVILGTVKYEPTLLCDFYKIAHKDQYPEGTEVVYSTLTPRSNRYMKNIDKVVAFGFQYFIKEYLVDYFNEMFFKRNLKTVVNEYERMVKFALGVENPDSSHIAKLWKLGYLPLEIKAISEGTRVPMKVPVMTIENTKPEFFWLTNYIETLLSSEIWQGITSASIASKYLEIGTKYAKETVGNTDHVPFQFHDFSFRGMSGLNTAALSGAGHLLSFVGTDTIPAIAFHEKYYLASIENELVGTSIPATEHSVMCANGTDEYESFKRLITEVYPKGFVSIVSDTWDFWNVIGDILPRLKEEIMNRDGKVVIRPDSGDPVDILCGKTFIDITSDEKYIKNDNDLKEVMEEIVLDNLREETPHGECGGDGYGEFKFKDKYYKVTVEPLWNRYDKQYYYIDGVESVKVEEFTPSLSDLGLVESLWNIFGGSVNSLGYKEIDPHIGAIYGDSITLERAEQIFSKLKEKGFASSNVVLGVGSFTYQHNTRDTFGFAVKATYAEVNGEERLLFKDPKTDDGTKKSQRGRVVVYEHQGEIIYEDGHTKSSLEKRNLNDMLQTIFLNGKQYNKESLSTIRQRLLTQL